MFSIPHFLSAGKVKTTNKRPYVGVNGTVEGLVIQSDKPLCYEENGDLPPYDDRSDADTLGGHPAEDFVLDSELTEALAGKADATHTHEISQVTGLDTALAGKADSSHNHSASQVTAGTFAGDVVAKSGGAVGTKMVRNIYAGTSDIGAGASLSTGDIYLVYE